MISDTAAMRFAVTWCGEAIDIPDPERTPPLDAFVKAYRSLQSGESLECYKPQKRLGSLALHRDLVRAQRPRYPSSFEPPIDSPVHHVALLRAPHFVVRYLPGDALPGDVAEYAGVFEADRSIDEVFARAEPPTHDDWVARQLQGEERTWVNTTYTRLTERLRAFARPAGIEIVGTGGIPLGAASAQFAGLVATAPSLGGRSGTGQLGEHGGTTEGTGGERGGGQGGGTDGGSKTPPGRIEELGSAEHGTFDDVPALMFPFRIRRAVLGATVAADVAVAVDESLGREKEAPAGSAGPSLLGWLGPTGECVRSQRLTADGRIGEIWSAAVRPAADTVTSVALKVVGTA